jgi:hypothetical protein
MYLFVQYDYYIVKKNVLQFHQFFRIRNQISRVPVKWETKQKRNTANKECDETKQNL